MNKKSKDERTFQKISERVFFCRLFLGNLAAKRQVVSACVPAHRHVSHC